MLVGSAAAIWSVAARAQQPTTGVRRIAVLMAFNEDNPDVQSWLMAFRKELDRLADGPVAQSPSGPFESIGLIRYDAACRAQGEAVKRRSRAGGKLVKTRRRKLVTLKRRNASNASRNRSSFATKGKTEVALRGPFRDTANLPARLPKRVINIGLSVRWEIKHRRPC